MFDWSIYRLFVINIGSKRDPLQITIFVNVCSTWDIVELKTRLETSITWNDVNGVSWFHLSYLITIKAYLCSQRKPNALIKYFVFDWSIYRQFVLNTGWKCVFLQMIFVNVCSTCNIVELKTRFETWITRNDVNGVSLFHLSYLTTLMALTTAHKGHQMSNLCKYVSLVHLRTNCVKYGLDTWFSPNNDIRICFLDMKHSWTKNTFWDVNNKKSRKWCKFFPAILFNNTYGFPVLTMDTKRPNQVFYVCLVDLQTICVKCVLDTWLSPNNDIRICFLDMKQS
jgi:hypothetical protein